MGSLPHNDLLPRLAQVPQAARRFFQVHPYLAGRFLNLSELVVGAVQRKSRETPVRDAVRQAASRSSGIVVSNTSRRWAMDGRWCCIEQCIAEKQDGINRRHAELTREAK